MSRSTYSRNPAWRSFFAASL